MAKASSFNGRRKNKCNQARKPTIHMAAIPRIFFRERETMLSLLLLYQILRQPLSLTSLDAPQGQITYESAPKVTSIDSGRRASPSLRLISRRNSTLCVLPSDAACVIFSLCSFSQTATQSFSYRVEAAHDRSPSSKRPTQSQSHSLLAFIVEICFQSGRDGNGDKGHQSGGSKAQ